MFEYRQDDIGLCRITLTSEEKITSRVKQRVNIKTKDIRGKGKEKDKDLSGSRGCEVPEYLKKVSSEGFSLYTFTKFDIGFHFGTFFGFKNDDAFERMSILRTRRAFEFL